MQKESWKNIKGQKISKCLITAKSANFFDEIFEFFSNAGFCSNKLSLIKEFSVLFVFYYQDIGYWSSSGHKLKEFNFSTNDRVLFWPDT